MNDDKPSQVPPELDAAIDAVFAYGPSRLDHGKAFGPRPKRKRKLWRRGKKDSR